MLDITIFSFSYKKGLPQDNSGNGGGFVFDCRGIENPGRYDQYKSLTGRDQEVKDFLLEKTTINEFLLHAFSIVKMSVDNYLERDFSHLQVSFGCTGGQHRSVFSADAFGEWLQQNYADQLEFSITHREQEAKNWING